MKKAWLQRHTIGEDYESSLTGNNTKSSTANPPSSTEQQTTTQNGSSAAATSNDDSRDRDDSLPKATNTQSNNTTTAVNSIGKKTGKTNDKVDETTMLTLSTLPNFFLPVKIISYNQISSPEEISGQF